MAVGFILINILSGHEDEVCKQLSKEETVVECNLLHACEYDLLVKVNGNNYEEIGEFVIRKIRTIDGIFDTKTLLGTLMV